MTKFSIDCSALEAEVRNMQKLADAEREDIEQIRSSIQALEDEWRGQAAESMVLAFEERFKQIMVFNQKLSAYISFISGLSGEIAEEDRRASQGLRGI